MPVRRAAIVLVLVALLAAPVAAHGNYVSVDAQVSTDGTVRVEFGVILTDGFVVLHRDDDGAPGDVVGQRRIDGYRIFDYPVNLTESYWERVSGSTTLWVVLHRDTGDGEFTPGEDPPLTALTSDRLVADRIRLGKSRAGSTYIGAEGEQPQTVTGNHVTIRSVRLPDDGYVVVRTDDDGEPGRIVGTRQLGAGRHERVRIPINQSADEEGSAGFRFWAIVHGSDGDAIFEPAADPAVMAGDTRVMTRFVIDRMQPAGDTTATGGRSPTASPNDAVAVITASPEPDCAGAAEAGATGETETLCPSTTPASHPGFGVLATAVGIGLALLIATRRSD